MQSARSENDNAAGAAFNTNGIIEIEKIVPSNHSIKGVGRKLSLFRSALDYSLSPLWVRLPRHKGRFAFRVLGFVLGRTKLYGTLAASYIRFLHCQEAS